MRYLKETILTAIVLLTAVAPAFAATLDRGKPTNFVVWAFLTCCALIVIVQLLPKLRALISNTGKTTENTHANKQHNSHIKN